MKENLTLRKVAISLCPFCEVNATYDELPVCRHCLLTLQKIINQKCKTCGNSPDECTCPESKNIRFMFFFDDTPSRTLIYWLKTNFEKRRMNFFAELMIRNSNIIPSEFDGVTYVPRRKRNIKKYGYDQAKELAKSVSENFGIPFITALKRIGKGDQKLLSYSQRMRNAKKQFALCYTPETKFKKLLIVDDIVATGATINACASILRKDFAESVVPLVIAKTNYQK